MENLIPISLEDAFAIFDAEQKEEVETQDMTKADAEKVIESDGE